MAFNNNRPCSLINSARGRASPAAAESRNPKRWCGRCARKSWSAAPATDSATYTAEIRSRYETDLSFQVGGKLVNRAVDVGATVKKGQLLAQLDQTDQQLGVDAARGAVPAAQSDLDAFAQRRGAVSRPARARPHDPRAVPGAADGGALRPRPNYRRPPRSCGWRSSGWATPRCAPAKTASSRACWWKWARWWPPGSAR